MKSFTRLILKTFRMSTQQEIGIDLSSKEIKIIIKSIEKKINWYDAIADSINDLK